LWQDQYAEALAVYQESQSLFDQLVREQPANHEYLSSLGRALHGVATISEKQRGSLAGSPSVMTNTIIHQSRQAIRHQVKALTGAEQQGNRNRMAQYRQLLGDHYFELYKRLWQAGRLDEAWLTVQERKKLWADDALELFNVAESMAFLATVATEAPSLSEQERRQRRQQYADEAMATLKAALDKGFLYYRNIEKRPIEHLEEDDALKVLCGRDDFQKLLEQQRERLRKKPY
jgi:hypothetical protein